ncbi:hypothetical protein ACMXZI_09300 [Bacillus subtilis]|uniref:hypothetical protein n=1 Tax=Bacillus subtilis TaxID=1423 RepID=UPI0013D865D0|nr:hypothetical protein [Bacillus subtilis]MDP8527360.1 hypothetical protein [Bacillus subtilis]WFA93327.1 hypothetical protein LFL98_06410 [Bacillus subtilis]
MGDKKGEKKMNATAPAPKLVELTKHKNSNENTNKRIPNLTDKDKKASMEFRMKSRYRD